MSKDLVVVGSVALDSIKTIVDEKKDILGGSATFFSLAASRFTNVKVVAVVGEDFPDAYVQMLNSHKIDTAGLEKVAGGKTFRWSGVYSDDYVERTTLDTQLNVFEKFQPKLNEDYAKAPILFLANIHPDIQLDVLSQTTNCEFVACDTMNLWINTTMDSLAKVMKKVDLITINDEESFLLTGKRNIYLAAEEILKMGPKYLIIKRGEFGAVLFGEGKRFLLPAYPVTNVIDPTGAGDSFAGGMMGYLATCDKIDFEAIRRSIVVGTLIASFSVEDFSVTRLEALQIAELEERENYFALVTGFDLFKMLK